MSVRIRKERTITKRNFATLNMRKNRVKKVWNSYRDELRVQEPETVDERFAGGAFGCPGEYFRGAPVLTGGCGFRERCEGCWSRLYADEEWIPYEKRDE